MGAVATILAVGVSPFVQQMATVQNTLVSVNLPAYVGRAQTYLESDESPSIENEDTLRTYSKPP